LPVIPLAISASIKTPYIENEPLGPGQKQTQSNPILDYRNRPKTILLALLRMWYNSTILLATQVT
jgi:hypothetical protein